MPDSRADSRSFEVASSQKNRASISSDDVCLNFLRRTLPVASRRQQDGSSLRIGLLTQWYSPETGSAAVPGVLARSLAERGHEVKVLTGFPNYPTGTIAPGYRVQRRF